MALQETYLITGGNGYIARNLINFLEKQGHNLVFLNREASNDQRTFSSKDYLDGKLNFEQLGNIDFVFHLAGVYSPEMNRNTFIEMLNSNFSLTSQLLFDASSEGAGILVAGSHTQDMYGVRGNALTAYAALKNAAEVIAQFLSHNTSLQSSVARISETYGMFDNRPKLLYRIIDSLLTQEPILLPNSDLELNFVHIDDLVSALTRIKHSTVSHVGFRIYDVLCSKPVRLSEIIHTLEVITQHKLQLVDGMISTTIKPKSISGVQNAQIPDWQPLHNIMTDLESIVENRKLMIDHNLSGRLGGMS